MSNVNSGLQIPKKSKIKGIALETKVGHDLSVNEKKRHIRNIREQQRSFKISKQIDQLKELLQSSGFRLEKSSKTSVLAGVAEYVKELQTKSQEIDNGFRRVILQSDVDVADLEQQEIETGTEIEIEKNPFLLDREDLADCQFREIFYSSPIPLALTDKEGRFLDCNQPFLEVASLSKELLEASTLFSLVEPSSLLDAYSSVATLLQQISVDHRNDPLYLR
jgi:PAS domain-containing protein